MTRVTSTVFQKEFGRFRTLAHKEPVIITHHGRDDVVLLPVDEYHRLCGLDQQAFYPHELPDEVIEGLGTDGRIPDEACQFTHEYPVE